MDISSLPYFTPLVKDYISRFDSSAIHNFFDLSPRAPHEQFRKIIDRRLLRERSLPAEHRNTVVDSIRNLHASLNGLTDAAEHNLELLRKPQTMAVVTGQQTGILGGPLYTFYKTYSAIQLAKSLSAKYEGFAFVPVFWIETEDHDLEEISSVHVLGAEGQVESVKYVPSELRNDPSPVWRKQAGPTKLEETALNEFFEGLQAKLPKTEFSDRVQDLLRQLYSPGRSFSEAFAAMLLQYFGDDGLLLVDANSNELKALGKELFHKEIETSPLLSEKIVLQSVQLEEAYHAQVKPRALNLFYINDDGERLAIVEREKTADATERIFFLRGTRKTFTLAELLATVDEHPERFSPNVVMRPLFQDSLLPTAAYVAGPGEIAYFAQFRAAYEWTESLPMPLIHPRFSATIIEERLERVFTKFHVTAEDVLSEAHGRNTALFDALIDTELIPKFEAAITEIDTTLEDLRDTVKKADATLDGALTSLKGKLLTSLRDFKDKTLAAERKRHSTAKAQLDKLLAAILPSGELQERELSLVYYLNKYGLTFTQTLKQLIAPIALDFQEHHVVHLAQGVTQKGMEPGNFAETRTSSEVAPLSAVHEAEK